ncbi:unnamed protein product, partial [Heterotrigona itama]
INTIFNWKRPKSKFLNDLLIRLSARLRFAETVENCFNVMLLVQMLSFIVQLCFQCFQAIMRQSRAIYDVPYHTYHYLRSLCDGAIIPVLLRRRKTYAGEYGCSQRSVQLRMVQFTSKRRKTTCNYYVSSHSIAAKNYSGKILLVYCAIIFSELNYQFGWNRYIMKYVDIWPEERKWNKPSSYIVLLPILLMMRFVCGLQFLTCRLGSALMYLLKYIAKDCVTMETKTGRETMLNIARITRWISIISSIMCQLVVASYVILRLYFIKYDDNKLYVAITPTI